MKSSNRAWLLLALWGGIAFCLGAALVVGLFVLRSGLPLGDRSAGGDPASSPPVIPLETSTSGPTAPALIDESESLPADVRAQMDEIESQVIALRGLRATGSVIRDLLTPEELVQHVLEDFLADYSEQEARDDALVLALFGLVSESFDLWGLYLDLYSEQIAGFYDDDERAMYIVRGSSFGGPERLTYAHEYVHALQDLAFDFDDGLDYTEEGCEADSERCAGIQALIEGDATLLEEQWLRTYASQDDIRQILDFYESYESPVFDSAPPFLQQDFLFAYTEGLNFVQHLFRQGGWAAVDAAYADPPRSTEQILHPERYPEDAPVQLELPDLLPALGPGWRELDRDVLGELFSRLMLEVHLPTEQAHEAAAGWGGDAYAAYYHDDLARGVLVLISAWDTIRDAQDFMLAMRDYGDARFGEHSATDFSYTWSDRSVYVLVERQSDQTLWILAPDRETGEALRAAITFPAPSP